VVDEGFIGFHLRHETNQEEGNERQANNDKRTARTA
jgi:hypothetical protein